MDALKCGTVEKARSCPHAGCVCDNPHCWPLSPHKLHKQCQMARSCGKRGPSCQSHSIFNVPHTSLQLYFRPKGAHVVAQRQLLPGGFPNTQKGASGAQQQASIPGTTSYGTWVAQTTPSSATSQDTRVMALCRPQASACP